MASLAQQTELEARIDRSLDYLIKYWSAVPDIASGWPERTEDDRLDFVLEWPLRVDRLIQLRRWEGEGRLSPMQRQRLLELELLVRQHNAMLDRLLQE